MHMEKFLQHWQTIRQQLKSRIGATQFSYWLEKLRPVTANADRVILASSTGFERDRIVQLYGDLIARLVVALAPEYGPVEFTVTPTARPITSGNTALAVHAQPEIIAPTPAPVPGSIPLNRACTFETFVVGTANEIAVAQARRVAGSDTQLANPLLLFGGTGLGKSHLIHATLQRILARDPGKRVLYVTAEWFLGKFVAAVRSGDTADFKTLVRDVDALAIDDLHIVIGKDKTTEELLHTFDAVVDAGKQLILSADRSPALLEGLNERIRSRLLKGVTVEIKHSDFDLRLAILEAKAARITRENPRIVIGGEALRFIAQRINANTRELEGALHRIVSHSNNGEEPITLQNLQLWLTDFLKLHDRRVTIEEIKAKTATFFGCKIADLESESRARDVVRPRQTAMYLARQMTTRSLPDIARRFNRRDHTTVMHALKQVEKRRDLDPEFAQMLEALRLSIRNWPAQSPLH
jgi:chromosomal replication initiator protein